jgi:hypothetical protein
MGQVRFNYNEGNVKDGKGRQVSLYIGMANSIAEARQVVIENIDEIDCLTECVTGNLYFDNRVIG